MKIIDGGVTSPKGYKAYGQHIGIKKQKKDLALIYSEVPARVSGMFTTNIVKAAPVVWNQKIVDQKGVVRGVVVNSGNANACTGEMGVIHNQMMAQTMAECLQVDAEEILVASTGVIGVPLPIDKIIQGIRDTVPFLDHSIDCANKAAEAIMTTDTFVKQIAIEIEIQGKPIRIGGMAKGSGMIHPNMATMLSFITTDVCISPILLEEVLKETVEDSYNMISVDGDTSTNDMVILISNGLAGNQEITLKEEEYEIFKKALQYVNIYLAQQIVHDGEGASKFLEVHIEGAATKEIARKLVKSIVSSSLVKTAFFGEDANWGRILAAMGYAGVHFTPQTVDISFENKAGTVTLMKQGSPIPFEEEKVSEILKEKEIHISIGIKDGEASATAWGCDLSYEYVRINGDYRT